MENKTLDLDKFKYPEEEVGNLNNFYREIFLEGEYDRYGSVVEEGDVVVDFGAFIGMFSHFALTKGAKHVYAVEANESSYDCLVSNSNPNITTYHGFVSDRRDDDSLYNLDRIMDENNLTSVDYLKMDIEGSEYPTLINIPDETMKKVNKWAIEFHMGWSQDTQLWNHGHDFDSHRASKLLFIMEKFSRNGFKLAYEQIHKDYDLSMLYAWK